MAPGTLWRRAVRRVDRRAATVKALLPMAYVMGRANLMAVNPADYRHCADCERAVLLLRQACRLANDLSRGAR